MADADVKKSDLPVRAASAVVMIAVAGTALASWRARHVDDLAERLMTATAALLERRFAVMRSGGS